MFPQVKIWDIPLCGIQQNLTRARKTLTGHTRRVGLIEWHPTAENLLLSSAYDYKVRYYFLAFKSAVLLLFLRFSVLEKMVLYFLPR